MRTFSKFCYMDVYVITLLSKFCHDSNISGYEEYEEVEKLIINKHFGSSTNQHFTIKSILKWTKKCVNNIFIFKLHWKSGYFIILLLRDFYPTKNGLKSLRNKLREGYLHLSKVLPMNPFFEWTFSRYEIFKRIRTSINNLSISQWKST